MALVNETLIVSCDSMTVLAYIKDTKYHRQSKHIDMQYLYIPNVIAQQDVSLRIFLLLE